MEFFLPLHREFTPRQQELALKRVEVLQRSLEGDKPTHRFPSDTVRNGWRITLPEWCRDQRNQMTGPADDAELCVKMLNSGAPGVMLDLEDSCVNEWTHHETGVSNILACLRGELSYFDKKRNRSVTIQQNGTVIFTRPRGLHLNQAGLIPGELVSASLIDVARIFYSIDPDKLKTSALHLHSKVGIGGGSAVVARSVPGAGRSGADCRTTTSSAWRWWSRTHWHFRWKNSRTTCAITSSG